MMLTHTIFTELWRNNFLQSSFVFNKNNKTKCRKYNLLRHFDTDRYSIRLILSSKIESDSRWDRIPACFEHPAQAVAILFRVSNHNHHNNHSSYNNPSIGNIVKNFIKPRVNILVLGSASKVSTSSPFSYTCQWSFPSSDMTL